MFSRIKKTCLVLAKPDIFFFTLIWLMVLLVAGTVAQKYIGLYQAQNKYFSSFILWLGFVPLPGGKLTFGLMFINLLCKLSFGSPWRWHQAGIIIAHLGAMLLLTGGILTSYFSTEGSMLIYEGDKSNYVEDYHQRELAIYESGLEEDAVSVPFNKLKRGKELRLEQFPFSVEIVQICGNSDFDHREQSSDISDYRSRAAKYKMICLPLEREDEENRAGAMFRIRGAGEDDGIYFSVDFVDVNPEIVVNGKKFNVAIRKKRTFLPFEIALTDFFYTFHPGTDIPASFRSEVTLADGPSRWPSVIQMNEPLRYKGYTFYQSSYIDQPGRQATVLAVVRNAGRMFPYISSIVMCLGLLIHMSIQIPKLIRK